MPRVLYVQYTYSNLQDTLNTPIILKCSKLSCTEVSYSAGFLSTNANNVLADDSGEVLKYHPKAAVVASRFRPARILNCVVQFLAGSIAEARPGLHDKNIDAQTLPWGELVKARAVRPPDSFSTPGPILPCLLVQLAAASAIAGSGGKIRRG